MVNNFEQISKLLNFESEDDFYFVQIIQRKKDTKVKGTNNSNRLVRYHVITSVDKLLKLKEEMIEFATYFNARVCINLNRRSFERVAFKSLKNISDAIVERDFQRSRYAWLSACGQVGGKEKRWIIDVDDTEYTAYHHDTSYNIIGMINRLKPEGNKHVATIPSKSGYHIISTPFDLKTFSMYFPSIEVHKNNPTNLFIP